MFNQVHEFIHRLPSQPNAPTFISLQLKEPPRGSLKLKEAPYGRLQLKEAPRGAQSIMVIFIVIIVIVSLKKNSISHDEHVVEAEKNTETP